MPEYVEGEKSSGLLRAIEKKKEIVGVSFADFYTCVCMCVCVCFHLLVAFGCTGTKLVLFINIYFNVTITVLRLFSREKRVAERIVTRPWLAKMAIMIAQFEAKCDGFLSLFCRHVWMG